MPTRERPYSHILERPERQTGDWINRLTPHFFSLLEDSGRGWGVGGGIRCSESLGCQQVWRRPAALATGGEVPGVKATLSVPSWLPDKHTATFSTFFFFSKFERSWKMKTLTVVFRCLRVTKVSLSHISI